MRNRGEFAGEVNEVAPGEFSYDTPRYYKGDEGRNLIGPNTVYGFHSHRPGGGEVPSRTDFNSFGSSRFRPTGALFTASGAVRTFTQVRTPRATLFGVIPLPDRVVNTYQTIRGEPYRGR
jgi:hypothetical protein